MRLHDNEHRDLTTLLEKYGLEVLLTKKKGWIHIRVHNKVFSYHRKKVTDLVDGQFQDHYRYFIEENSHKMELPDWESVYLKLSDWINSPHKIS